MYLFWLGDLGQGLRKWVLTAALVLALSPLAGWANDAAEPEPVPMTLAEYLERVLKYSEAIQVRMLETEISRRQAAAERGIFEPEVTASYERQERERAVTEEQRRSFSSFFSPFTSTVFEEKNNVYSSGLEALVPTGARLRLGYNLRDLRNDLNRGNFPDGEYETTVGLTLVQPLLKNAGISATMAAIRAAAVNSDIAFQTYRQGMMEIVARAEASYWDLYLNQQQHEISQESVALARTILDDNRTRLELGKSSELEVVQAEAGLAARLSLQSDARQRLLEAVNRAATLYSGSVLDGPVRIKAVEDPQTREISRSYQENWAEAFELNPDYLSRRKRIELEGIRLVYARNQRLPQLDLRGTYGMNGIGDSPGSSMDQVTRHHFPAWTAGVELRVPLGGGVKSRNELHAAQLRQRQALLGLQEIEVQIANALDSALHKVAAYRSNVKSYQMVVEFNQRLLETQLARLEVGKVDSRTVLETEEDLFEAKIALLENLIQYQRALLELELVKGSILQARNLDLTQADLASKTSTLVRGGRISETRYREFVQDVQVEFEQQAGAPRSRATAEEEALRLLRQKIQTPDAPDPRPNNSTPPGPRKRYDP